MKIHIQRAILSILLISLYACDKPKSSTAVPVEPDGTTAPVEQPAATPVPVVAIATPAPSTPPPDPMAPEGVFYLLTKASVVTDDGIVGLNPGSKLQRNEPGVYMTSAGQTVRLRDEQVTNNLRLAGMAVQSDAAAQAGLRNERAKVEKEVAAREAANRAAQANVTAESPNRATSRMAVAPVQPVTSPSAGTGGLGAVKSDKDNGFRDSAGFRHWTDVRGRWHTDNPAFK